MFGYRNVLIYKENEGIVRGNIQIENGKIISFDDHPTLKTLSSNLIIIPGFIDEHMHGANGADAMDATWEALENIATSIVRDGVTSFLATTMTEKESKIEAALSNISAYHKQPHSGAQLLGIHLEGPFICAKFCGAQDAKYRQPLKVLTMEKYRRLGDDLIKMVTLAYEEQGADLVDYLVKNHIVASIGHSDCPSSLVKEAIAHGLSCSTHTFNAMRGIHHRDIGTVGEVLLCDEIMCELIADLHHVSPDAIRLLYKMKGANKIILITDSMEARFLPEGQYQLGGQKVYARNGMATLEDGTLAGSILRMPQAIKNMQEILNLPLENIIDMASKNPAINLGIDDKKGSLAIGKDADFVITDQNMTIYKTFIGGEEVYSRE